jgi:GNAT superfamily N-acetyltransferase
MAEHGEVRLERAGNSDANTLADISKRAFHSDVHVGAPKGDEGSSDGGGGPPGYDSSEFQSRMMKVCQYYKMIYDGRVVGGLIASRRRPGHYELDRIFVDPEYHNKGIASRAFEQVWALYPDARIWTLGTPEWNVRTRHFYEKLGFVQVGWTRNEPDWGGLYYERVMSSDELYVRDKIGELREGARTVEVEANVLEKSEARMVRSSKTGETYRLAEATIRDETGMMKLVLWNDQIRQVDVDDKVRIEGGYVRSFRGELQLSISRYGHIFIML